MVRPKSPRITSVVARAADLAIRVGRHLDVEGRRLHNVANLQIAGHLERERVAHGDRVRQTVDRSRRECDVLVIVLVTLQDEAANCAVASVRIGGEVTCVDRDRADLRCSGIGRVKLNLARDVRSDADHGLVLAHEHFIDDEARLGAVLYDGKRL